MRIKITFLIESEIKQRLDEWATNCGLAEEEAIRYIIGNWLPLPTKSIHFPFSRTEVAPEQPSLSEKILARAISSQGAAKCPNCTGKLSTEDLISGRCSKCDEPI